MLCASLSCAKEPITIVRAQNFPPYHYSDENGVETGFIIDTINSVATLMGISVIYKQYPWSRCINMVEKGYADAMMNLFKTEKRSLFMDFADNIIAYETNNFFTLKSKNIPYTGAIDNLTAFKLGTIRNYSYGNKFDAVHFPLNFQMETETELVKALANNRCDLIIGNKLVLLNLLKTMQLESKIKILFPDVSREPLYIGFSKQRHHEALSQSFSEHLKKFKTSREYQTLIRTYALEP